MYKNLFPNITTMMRGYLNMDANEISGSDNMEGHVKYYASRVSVSTLTNVIREVEFISEYVTLEPTKFLNETFDYGYEVENIHELLSFLKSNLST